MWLVLELDGCDPILQVVIDLTAMELSWQVAWNKKIFSRSFALSLLLDASTYGSYLWCMFVFLFFSFRDYFAVVCAAYLFALRCIFVCFSLKLFLMFLVPIALVADLGNFYVHHSSLN